MASSVVIGGADRFEAQAEANEGRILAAASSGRWDALFDRQSSRFDPGNLGTSVSRLQRRPIGGSVGGALLQASLGSIFTRRGGGETIRAEAGAGKSTIAIGALSVRWPEAAASAAPAPGQGRVSPSLEHVHAPDRVSQPPAGFGAALQRSAGQTLSGDVRAKMEAAFGADLSGVRVHTGPDAQALTTSIRARAFATGHDVFFNQGEYDPHSARGLALLGHELTHVLQQRPGASPLSPGARALVSPLGRGGLVEAAGTRLQRKAVRGSGADAGTAPTGFHSLLGSSAGTQLSPRVQAELGTLLGADFSQVRVHTGESAATAARSINAEAFTLGRDIYFGAGRYDPNSARGLALIGHELTHVAQQGGGAHTVSGKEIRPKEREGFFVENKKYWEQVGVDGLNQGGVKGTAKAVAASLLAGFNDPFGELRRDAEPFSDALAAASGRYDGTLTFDDPQRRDWKEMQDFFARTGDAAFNRAPASGTFPGGEKATRALESWMRLAVEGGGTTLEEVIYQAISFNAGNVTLAMGSLAEILCRGKNRGWAGKIQGLRNNSKDYYVFAGAYVGMQPTLEERMAGWAGSHGNIAGNPVAYTAGGAVQWLAAWSEDDEAGMTEAKGLMKSRWGLEANYNKFHEFNAGFLGATRLQRKSYSVAGNDALEQQALANERALLHVLSGSSRGGARGPLVQQPVGDPPGAAVRRRAGPVGAGLPVGGPGADRGAVPHRGRGRGLGAGQGLALATSDRWLTGNLLKGHPGALAMKSLPEEHATSLGIQIADPFLDEAVAFLKAAGPTLGASADVAIGFIPIVGDIYDVLCGLMGRAIFTWDQLDLLDRILCFAGVIPIPFVSGAILRRGKKAASWLIKKAGVDLVDVFKKVVPRAIEFVKKTWAKCKDAVQRMMPKKTPGRPSGSQGLSSLTASRWERAVLRQLYGPDMAKRIDELAGTVDHLVTKFLPSAQFNFRPVRLWDAPMLWIEALRSGGKRAFSVLGSVLLPIGTLGGTPVEKIAFRKGAGGQTIVSEILATTNNPRNPLSMASALGAKASKAPNAALHELAHGVQFTALGAAVERGILKNTDEFWDVFMTHGKDDAMFKRALAYQFGGAIEESAQAGVIKGLGAGVTGKVGHVLDVLVDQFTKRIDDPDRVAQFKKLIDEVKGEIPKDLLYKRRGDPWGEREDVLHDEQGRRLGRSGGRSDLELLNDPGPGLPLEMALRNRLEGFLGADLSGVRLHQGQGAERLARAMGAEAFTLGNRIFVGEGWQPHTQEGLGTLVHEATHVVQSDQGRVAGLATPARTRVLEAEAYAHERAFLQGASAPTAQARPVAGPIAAPAPRAEPQLVMREAPRGEDVPAPEAAPTPTRVLKKAAAAKDPIQRVMDTWAVGSDLSREEFLETCTERVLELMREEMEGDAERGATNMAWSYDLPMS